MNLAKLKSKADFIDVLESIQRLFPKGDKLDFGITPDVDKACQYLQISLGSIEMALNILTKESEDV